MMLGILDEMGIWICAAYGMGNLTRIHRICLPYNVYSAALPLVCIENHLMIECLIFDM
jgi:ABC-type arginine/histidine transport system permease subunit